MEVRSLPDGEEIVLRPTGMLRYLPAAFLAFWLCGWAVGEAVVLVLLLGPAAAPLLEAAREVSGRLRAALGLQAQAALPRAGAGAEASAAIVPRPLAVAGDAAPGRGVILAAPSGKSRKTRGCALLVAFVVTSGAGALVAAAARNSGGIDGIVGLATAGCVLAIAVDALCLWTALARDAWVLTEGRVEGPSDRSWIRRRAVRKGTLAAMLSTDDDGDDWFTLEARGDGGPLRLTKVMGSGPEVLAFARFAAWHSRFA
ncbi:MAG: hypothetical protein IPF66_23160 [Holophagales bacterium]|nr:hypothetical protein [Holophagales bacterium]